MSGCVGWGYMGLWRVWVRGVWVRGVSEWGGFGGGGGGVGVCVGCLGVWGELVGGGGGTHGSFLSLYRKTLFMLILDNGDACLHPPPCGRVQGLSRSWLPDPGGTPGHGRAQACGFELQPPVSGSHAWCRHGKALRSHVPLLPCLW